jgi:hypothetical protein
VGDVPTLQHRQETPPPQSTSNSILVNSMIVVLVSKPFGTRISLGEKRQRDRKQKKIRKKKYSNCLYNLNKIFVSLKLPTRSRHMCFSVDQDICDGT